MTSRDEILAAIAEERIHFVDLWFTDITGMVKSVSVPAEGVEDALDFGHHFDGSSIEAFVRVAESDMVLIPDPESFVLLPWTAAEERSARLICSVYTPDGNPFIGDPRHVLINALQEAASMGYRYITGMELEFFLFRAENDAQPSVAAPHDHASYFDLSTANAKIIRRKMASALAAMHISIDSMHSETGAGQHEIDFHHNPALTSADHVLTARAVLKTIAQQHGLHCTFMPRPRTDMPGSGMHTHQSLHSVESGANLFHDPSDQYGLSQTARYFLAGQLRHARAMCAVLAPLVNSYKRLGTSFEAPVYVTWAHVNRGALIRVPSITRGKEAHTRLELRCPDPSSNPYLASAVMLQAGLDGIRQQLPLPEALEETILQHDRGRLRHLEMLPASLGEALDALNEDDVILAALGPYISDRYSAAKRQEFEAYNQQVTPWELDHYFSRY